MTKFIIFAHARSGSTSLAKSLNLHPQLNIAFEPFHPKYSQWNKGEKNYIDYIVDIKSLEDSLTDIYLKFNGMKVLDYQLPEELYTHMLLMPQFKIIRLSRKNILQAIVSGLVAEQTGVWQASDFNNDNKEVYKNIKALSFEEIKKRVQYLQEMQNYYHTVCSKRTDNSVLMLNYEDLYSGNLEKSYSILNDIFNFLEVPALKLAEISDYFDPKKSKINQSHNYDYIPNALEINNQFGNDVTGWLF